MTTSLWVLGSLNSWLPAEEHASELYLSRKHIRGLWLRQESSSQSKICPTVLARPSAWLIYTDIYLPSSFQVAALTSDLLTCTLWVSPGRGNTFPRSWQLAQNWQKLSVTFSYIAGLQRSQAWSLIPEPGPQITQVLVMTWKGNGNLKVIDQRTSMHTKADPDKVCS